MKDHDLSTVKEQLLHLKCEYSKLAYQISVQMNRCDFYDAYLFNSIDDINEEFVKQEKFLQDNIDKWREVQKANRDSAKKFWSIRDDMRHC